MSLSERIRPNIETAPWVIEEVRKLELELSAMQQRAEAAEAEMLRIAELNAENVGLLKAVEARIKASQEQEPVGYMTCSGMYKIDGSFWQAVGDVVFKWPTLYAAPVIQPDVQEVMDELLETSDKLEAVQRENAELTRKLAGKQYRANGCCCTFQDDGETPITICSAHRFMIDEAKSKAVPEFKTFNEWMHKEIPSGTIIGDAGWWASRIYRKFIAPSPETDIDQEQRFK